MKPAVNLFWFRRDLRLVDNAGLYHALQSGAPVLPVFIFDKNILDELEDKQDKRVQFIYDALCRLDAQLRNRDSALQVIYSTPVAAFTQLISEYDVKAVFTNHDYEPYAIQRDEQVSRLLNEKGILFHSYKDQVIFEKQEILKDNKEPYTVFTPYSRKWKQTLTDFYLKEYPVQKYLQHLYKYNAKPIPKPEEIGFVSSSINVSMEANEELIRNYDKTRDIPSVNGTTRLSVHLRFGTISIRHLVSLAKQWNEIFLNELIWREFYQMILWHFPHVVNGAFKTEYDHIHWRNNEDEFKHWCEGRTGYPIVDAGMRQLNETGYMHNRVRMITASFLTKHLLIDWHWGEAYFAKKLLDFDLSANNGGWQWAAGTGCDAAPYFRIFNPYLQTGKFDPQLKYILQWVPEYGTPSYPKPIVEHSFARIRCLKVYKEGLAKS